MYRPEPLSRPLASSTPWPRWALILAFLALTLAGILTGLYLE